MPFACEPKLYKSEPSTQVVLALAKNASEHIFALSSANELPALKSCFSATGFESFTRALKKTHNLDTMKKKGLTATSTVTTAPVLAHHVQGSNSWTVKMPIKVHFENQTHELTQQLAVQIIIELHAGQLSVESVHAVPKRA